jgi:hypothetical protein
MYDGAGHNLCSMLRETSCFAIRVKLGIVQLIKQQIVHEIARVRVYAYTERLVLRVMVGKNLRLDFTTI